MEKASCGLVHGGATTPVAIVWLRWEQVRIGAAPPALPAVQEYVSSKVLTITTGRYIVMGKKYGALDGSLTHSWLS